MHSLDTELQTEAVVFTSATGATETVCISILAQFNIKGEVPDANLNIKRFSGSNISFVLVPASLCVRLGLALQVLEAPLD